VTDAAHILALIANLDPADAPAVMLALAARLQQARQVPAPAAGLEQNNSTDDESLTIEEAAALLRRSTKWIYRHRGHLPFVRKIGPRSYLASKRGLLRWRDRQHS
jgi:hypothetical protein